MATDFITAIDISLGSALLPKPLERHTNKTGGSISLAPASATPSYLWIARAPDADPVVDIRILYDEEPCPEGYKKVARDLAGGASGKVFLAYKIAGVAVTEVRGVTSIALLKEEESGEAGHTVLERSLTRSGPAIRMALQFAAADGSSDGAISAWAEGLKVGDLLDCLDKQRRWRVAKVAGVSADGSKLTINFKGWAAKHDEEVPRASKRLAKPGVHTAGKDTRANRRQGDAFDVDLEVLASLEMRIDDYISGDFPAEEREIFAKGELPSYLEQVLSSKYDSDDLRDRINSFNQKVLELCVFHIKQSDKQLPPEVRQHLSRLFLDDNHCDYYFQHYGGIRPEHPLAATTNGFAARLPSGGASRYYVSNINHFHNLGGYDAIIQRYQAINAAARAASARASSVSPSEDKDKAEDNTLEEARMFSSIVFIPRLCYTADWGIKYYQPLRDAVMDRVLTLTDAQLKKASREVIDSIRANFVRLGTELTKSYASVAGDILAGPEGKCDGDVVQSAIERWQLALAARLIRCDSLALRVKGVGDVREMVESVEEAMSGTTKAKQQSIRYVGGVIFYGAPASTSAVWFDEPKLLAWLKENKVIDVIVGRKTDDSPVPPVHSQTVSRLASIISFVARNDFRRQLGRLAKLRAGEEAGEVEATEPGFTRVHVDALLKIAEEDDDALRKGVFDALLAGAKWSMLDDLEYIYTKLAALPLQAFGSALIPVYKGFADVAITRSSTEERLIEKTAQQLRARAAEESGAVNEPEVSATPKEVAPLSWEDARAWWSIHELWRLALDPASVSLTEEAGNQAIDGIVELLKPLDRYKHMAFMLDMTFDNINKGVCVYNSIRLAQALLKAIPLYNANIPFENCLEGSVTRVDARYNVMGLLLGEIHKYTESTKDTGAVRKGQLDTRLAFLLNVLQNSELTLSLENVKQLWGNFVHATATDEEKNIFFGWLFSARFAGQSATDVSNAVRLFPDSLIQSVFRTLFCSEEFFLTTNVSQQGFKAFDMFMRATNAIEGRIAGWDGDGYMVTDIHLEGLDTLWAIVMNPQSKEVAREAVSALIHMYVKLSLHPSAVPQSDTEKKTNALEKQELWRGFVDRCMSYIIDSLKPATERTDRAHSRTLAKVLRLLSTFLEAVEASGRSKNGQNKEMVVENDIIVLLQEGPAHPLPYGKEHNLDAFIRDESQKPPLQRLRLKMRPALETVGSLRDRLADAFEVDATRIRLTQLSQRDNFIPNTYDHLTVSEARLEYGVSGEVMKAAAPDTADHVYFNREQRIENQLRARLELCGLSDEEIDAEVLRLTEADRLEASSSFAPRKLLSEKQEYFDALFALLSVHNPSIVSDAWNLLQTLPISAKVEEDIHTLRGLVDGTSSTPPDWDSILDATAPLKLLYSLQIIAKLLDTFAESKETDAARCLADITSDWGRCFVRGGGLAHLVKLFLTVDWDDFLAPGKGKLMKECARLLLRTVLRFVRGQDDTVHSFRDDKVLVYAVDRAAIVKRAVSLLAYASTTHLPRDANSAELLAAADVDASGLPTSISLRGAESKDSDSLVKQNQSRFDFDDDGWGLSNMFRIGEEDDWFEQPKTEDKTSATAEVTPEQLIVQDALALLVSMIKGPTESLDVQALPSSPYVAGPSKLDVDATKAFYASPSIAGILLLALAAPKAASMRQAVMNSLTSLMKFAKDDSSLELQPLPSFLFERLFPVVDKAYAFPDSCSEFLTVLATAAELSTKLEPDASSAISKLAALLRDHPVVEIGSETRDTSDLVLHGLLKLTKGVLFGRPDVKLAAGKAGGSNLVDEIFEKVLFASPGEEADKVSSILGGRLPKGKQATTRKAAFEVLIELATDCIENSVRLCELLLPHHDAEAATLAAAMPGKASLARSLSGQKSVDDDEDTKPDQKGKYGAVSSTDMNKADNDQNDKGNQKMSGRGQTLVASRSSTGYVGLRNLGCICYMNATMQQFFMNPAFRRGVLSWKETASAKDDLDNSLMYQMQRQFAHLQESDKQYYNPKGLCHAIKDWEGNPTDVTEQKDVPEFLTKLFSDMETQCQGSTLASLPKDVFGGLTMQELIAEDPRGGGRKRLYATRDDMYYFLQVRIKNNKTLNDALAELVSGETVDYKWALPADQDSSAGAFSEQSAKEEKKQEDVTVKTTKRVSIKTLGDHLMLHLNRFEFNYESMQQEKLNDRFEFPRLLDMWPYTVYGRADSVAEAAMDSNATDCDRDKENYVFELVGVVIHMGTAIGGHYYSYIRERGDDSAGNRWFEFNDTAVSPWEGSDSAFDRDCYGGSEVYTSTYYGGSKHVSERVKSANAFVLYYDRVKKGTTKPDVAATGNVSAVTGAETVLGGAAATSDASLGTLLNLIPADAQAAFKKFYEQTVGVGGDKARAAVRAPMPADLLAQIQQENLEHRRLRTIYDLEYFAFMQQIVKATANLTSPSLAPFSEGSTDVDKYRVGYPWQGLFNTADAMKLGGPAMCAFRLAVAFMLNTLTDSNQTATTPVWLGFIRQLIANNEVAPAWLLQTFISDPADLRRMLYQDTTIAADSMRTISSSLGQICSERIWPSEQAGPGTADVAAVPPASSKRFIGMPGQIVKAFVTLLLQQLPRLHLHWRRFGAFFNLLNGLANIAGVRELLLADGLIGKLIDFALAGDSPHPELNDAPSIEAMRLGLELKRDPAGRVIPQENRQMGDAYAQPSFDDIFHLLRNLISSCLPPSGAEGSPFGKATAFALPLVDSDLLTCRQFLAAIVAQCSRFTFAKLYAPLVTHIFWGSVPADLAGEEDPKKRPDFGATYLCHTAAALIQRGIVVAEWDEQRSYFHFAKLICDVAGDDADKSKQRKRIDIVCNAIVDGLREQMNFFRATELGIENLTRLAKKRPLVRQWLRENREKWSWCETWYERFERCPTGAGADMKLMKRQQYGYYYQPNHNPMRDACTIHNIRSLLEGYDAEFDYMDSDDEPTELVGKPVTLSNNQTGRSVRAVIAGFDEKRGEHLLKFEDGSSRFQNIQETKICLTRFEYSDEMKGRIASRSGASESKQAAVEDQAGDDEESGKRGAAESKGDTDMGDHEGYVSGDSYERSRNQWEEVVDPADEDDEESRSEAEHLARLAELGFELPDNNSLGRQDSGNYMDLDDVKDD